MKAIEDFSKELNNISDECDKNTFIQHIKTLEKDIFKTLKELNLGPWSKGKGQLISHYLSLVKDLIIQRILRFLGKVPDEVAILAIGGYGRDEMSPFSDIDILIIHQQRFDPKDFVNRLFYILWDLNYKLGNSVRTVKNIIEHCQEDITLLTALFETRLIGGNAKLRQEMYQSLHKVLHSKRDNYIKEKLSEFHELSKKTAYAVLMKEPNLKENPGGLRSVHLARWTSFTFYNKGGMEGLAEVLNRHEYKKIAVAYDYILYIRNMLHFITNRHEDTLYIDHHASISQNLISRGDEYQKVIRMMHKIYNKAMDIFLISSHALDQIYVDTRKQRIKKLNKKYSILDNELFINEGVEASVEEALEVIMFCTQKQYLYSYSLIQYLRKCSRLITPEKRKSKEIFHKFIDILSLNNSYNALNLMKLSDFLYKYIPLFGKIRHFIIYNPFHKFTVDEHSIEGVWALERLLTFEYNKFDRDKVRGLIELADKHKEALWLVKLSLLMHDIGKAFSGEHSRNGVEIADLIFEEFPLSYRYRSLVKFLIKNHLLLSQISRRSDIQSQEVIMDLADKFVLTPYPGEYLDFLYLLTYSDVLATNPANFTGYTASLLRQLYLRTRESLSQHGEAQKEEDIIQNTLEEINKINTLEGMEQYISDLGVRYIRQNTPREIIQDYNNSRKSIRGEISIVVSNYNDVMEVKIFAPDHIGLFAQIAGILLLNGANITRANIYTYEGSAFDIFYITDIFGANYTKDNMQAELESWIARLKQSLHKFLDDDPLLIQRISDLKSRFKALPEIFFKKGNINITKREGNEYMIAISGSDRPSLLYDLCIYFGRHDMTIKSAIIDTIGWHIKDVFIVDAPASLDDAAWDKHRIELVKMLDEKD